MIKWHLPTSPAMPTIFGGWGRKGRDFDLSAIITTVLEALEADPEMNADAESIADKQTTA